ncbi:hypothetical protein SAMN05421823_10717 [Catalinimonas alkaloidigena]|uniref:Sulfotransferase family protein n=1 Tax=Catalinimonas alkaloidigena TaxID=1075417 RepID=A0A1G9LDM5_9BACT|nr:hypothetical protein [Catalinimonas alkaloidigena]SDL60060.1 hypothetical protein SAMN05421823_10717 [Catalinimonas alkaloidigena]
MISYNPSLPLISVHVPKCGGTSLDQVLEGWFSATHLYDPNKHPRLYPYISGNVYLQLRRFLNIGYHRHYRMDLFQADPIKIDLENTYGLLLNKRIPVCIHGHFNNEKGYGVWDYYPTAKQFITVLRDPLEMALSMYFYINQNFAKDGLIYFDQNRADPRPQQSLNGFISGHKINIQKYFPMELNVGNLQKQLNTYFIHAGVIEHLQTYLDGLAEKLGKKKVEVPVLNAAKRSYEPSKDAIDRFKDKNKLEYAFYEKVAEINA